MGLQVVWALNKAQNTGEARFPSLLVGALNAPSMPESSVQTQESPDLQTLLDWCSKNGFVRHPTTLADAIGVKLMCYARPYDSTKEHKGRNNVLSTYFTADKRTGLARNTVIGKAVFIRLDPDNNDRPVDFARDEFLRLGFCINDMMRFYEAGGVEELDRVLQNVEKAYPYYSATEHGDTMQWPGGFNGHEGRHLLFDDDGTLHMHPEDMQVVPSFIIP